MPIEVDEVVIVRTRTGHRDSEHKFTHKCVLVFELYDVSCQICTKNGLKICYMQKMPSIERAR